MNKRRAENRQRQAEKQRRVENRLRRVENRLRRAEKRGDDVRIITAVSSGESLRRAEN